MPNQDDVQIGEPQETGRWDYEYNGLSKDLKDTVLQFYLKEEELLGATEAARNKLQKEICLLREQLMQTLTVPGLESFLACNAFKAAVAAAKGQELADGETIERSDCSSENGRRPSVASTRLRSPVGSINGDTLAESKDKDKDAASSRAPSGSSGFGFSR